MILENFTFSEIKNDIEKDRKKLLKTIYFKLNKFIKYCEINKIQEKEYSTKWTSKNKNTYLIVYFRDSISYGFTVMNYYYNKHGINVNKIYHITETNYMILHFNTHFFDRYRERMHVPSSTKIIDLILQFDRVNGGVVPIKNNDCISEQEKVYKVDATFSDGIGRGIKVNRLNLVIVNTFVSFNMLKGRQIDEFKEAEAVRIYEEKCLNEIYRMAG